MFWWSVYFDTFLNVQHDWFAIIMLTLSVSSISFMVPWPPSRSSLSLYIIKFIWLKQTVCLKREINVPHQWLMCRYCSYPCWLPAQSLPASQRQRRQQRAQPPAQRDAEGTCQTHILKAMRHKFAYKTDPSVMLCYGSITNIPGWQWVTDFLTARSYYISWKMYETLSCYLVALYCYGMHFNLV